MVVGRNAGFVGTSNALDVPFIISNTLDGYPTAVAFIEKETSGSSTSKEHSLEEMCTGCTLI